MIRISKTIGQKFRLYRRYLPYPLILSAFFFSSPTLLADASLDAVVDLVGVAIACSGQALRLWAWGANSTTGLRTRGPYAFIRHPLYAGNFLIGLGLLVVFNASLAYLIVVPSLVLLYWRVTEEEEDRLEEKWGVAYAEYRAKVPRFFSWRGRVLKEGRHMTFDWRRALDKEHPSICGWMAGAICLEVYEEILSYGLKQAQNEVLFWFAVLSLLGLFQLILTLQKRKTRRDEAVAA